MSLFYPTRLGKNIRFVFGRASCYVNDIPKSSPSSICKMLNLKWNQAVIDDDIQKGYQIRELIMERDDFNDWILNRDECQTIISVLCTE